MDFLAIVLAIILVALLVKLNTKSRLAQMMEKLPGPPTVPVFGNILQSMVPREKLMRYYIGRNAQYGPLYRTWLGPTLPIVHLTKADHVEKILSSNKHIRKGKIYKFLYPWLGTGLLTSEGAKWFKHRKMITPTFHFQILDSFIDVFNENTGILVQRLTNCVNKDAIDVFPYITLCALDIICETAMGTKVNAQTTQRSAYVTSLYKIAELTMKRTSRLWFYPDALFYLFPMGREYKKNLNTVHGFTEGVIKERKELRKLQQEQPKEELDDNVGVKKRKAFLDLLLDSSNSEHNHLTDLELREEVDTFMFEGHDTTTAAICWSLMLLGENQKVQNEVYEELQEIFQDDPERPATMKDLQEMKCLERVIKEALRHYPSVPLISRMLDEDVQLGEYLLPKGTSIVIHIYELHQDEKMFPNPKEFNPDHFLPENVQKRNPYAYVPFSAGPRNCIGQKFAILEEKCVLSSLLRKYRFEAVDKRENLTLLNELVLRPAGGIKLKVYNRN